jgi:hypothetical protein
MKTTLNLPEALVSHAKILAVREKTTLTRLIAEGLKMRMDRGKSPRPLPVSTATGGLQPGLSWENLHRAGDVNEDFR